jgi:VWFA-related protein
MTQTLAKVLAGCSLAVSLSTSAQAPPKAGQTATLTVYAREVVMDVVALDAKGHSVTGLKPSDFQVIEDGVPQVVKGLSEHHAMTPQEIAAATPAKLPPNTFSNFVPQGNTNSVNVIVIDALDCPLVAQMYLREQLIAFMKTVPAGNMFAIFQLDNSMHLVQGFTSDPDVLLKAVRSKRDSVIMQSLLYKGNYGLREQILNEGLHVMGSYLAGIPGRKNLIWFTGAVPHTIFGLSRNPFPDLVDYDDRNARPANALSLSRIAMYPVDARGLQVYEWGNFSHPDLERLADTTGGKAFFNTNGLKDALTQITATGSNYYTIAYSPTNPIWRAHHRDVKIVLPGRRDVTLQYRHIYYARSERGAQRKADAKPAAQPFTPETPPAVADGETSAVPTTSTQDFNAAMRLGAVPSGELVFDVSASPATSTIRLKKEDPPPAGNFLSEDLLRKPFRQVDLLFKADASKISFEQRSDGTYHAELQFVAVVYNAAGEEVNSFAVTREFSLKDTEYQKALNRQLTVSSKQTIAVPEKGNYFLRLGVVDTTSELMGTLEIPADNILPGVAGLGLQTAP